jgi:biotin carboxyl carrier protein
MKYKVTLRGKVYEVEVERGEAILLDEYEAVAPAPATPAVSQAAAPAQPAAAAPAVNAGADVAGTQVNAPMPGNILDVRVHDGAAVAEGDVLCILEAMKMENEILAPHAGTVTVLTSKGMVVDTGDLLFVVS